MLVFSFKELPWDILISVAVTELFFLFHHCPRSRSHCLTPTFLVACQTLVFVISIKDVGRLHPFFRSGDSSTRRQAPKPLCSCLFRALSLHHFTSQCLSSSCLCSEDFQLTDHPRCSPFVHLQWGYIFSLCGSPFPKWDGFNPAVSRLGVVLTWSQCRPARPSCVYLAAGRVGSCSAWHPLHPSDTSQTSRIYTTLFPYCCCEVSCTHLPVCAGAAIFFTNGGKQPSWAGKPSPGCLLLAWKSYRGPWRCWSISQSRCGSLGRSSLLLIHEDLLVGWCRAAPGVQHGAAPRSRGWREHPASWGLGKGHQAAVQSPCGHSPHPVLQDPSSSQSTRAQTLQVRMQQHKRQQM